MAFHVRVFKHNVLKFVRIRSVSFSTEVNDKSFDNVTADEAQVQLINKRGKLWPDKSLMENLPAVVESLLSKTNCSLVLQSLSATQTLPGMYNNENKNILPMSSDIESILLVLNSSRNKKTDDTGNMLDYLKPVNYTTDDILTSMRHRHVMDYSTSSDTVNNKDNTPVTLLQYSDIDHILRSEGVSSNIETDHVLLCSSGTDKNKAIKTSDGAKDGPTQVQLDNIKEIVIHGFQKFFKEPIDYRFYHQTLIFENNLWGKNKVYRGLNSYALQLLKFRQLANILYTSVGIEILGISSHIEDGTVVVRWRVGGLPQTAILKFWKFFPWDYRKNVISDSVWHDGISIFTVKGDGLVHKHRIDRFMELREPSIVKARTIAAKLALLIGLAPKPNLNDFSAGMFMKKTNLNPK